VVLGTGKKGHNGIYILYLFDEFSNVQLNEKNNKSKILPGDSLLGIDKNEHEIANMKSHQ
jgi:hypothetical protein